jgi:hypothetical protein
MQSGFRQTGLRAVLSNSEVPTRSRMRAMVALQHISGRISSPLLRNVLNDASEDLRLLAYGMLDSLERNISRAIDKELDTLQKAREIEGQDTLGPVGIQAAEKLSALYWELVYQNLAQGDMRDHAIRESLLLEGEAGVSFIASHATMDAQHMAGLRTILNQLPDEAALGAVVEATKVNFHHFTRILEAI